MQEGARTDFGPLSRFLGTEARLGFGGWAVGGNPHFLPAGLALPMFKGSDFVLQIHFHLSGKPETEQSTLGIYFADTTPVPLLEMYTKGIRFHTGRVHARPAMEPLMELVRAGKFKPEQVTGETADWEDAPEAVAGHRSKLVISR